MPSQKFDPDRAQEQRDALLKLIPEHRLAVEGIVGRGDAEDVLQDASVKILEKMHQLKEWNKAPGWVRMVVRSTALDHLRKRQRLAKSLEDEDQVVDRHGGIVSQENEEDQSGVVASKVEDDPELRMVWPFPEPLPRMIQVPRAGKVPVYEVELDEFSITTPLQLEVPSFQNEHKFVEAIARLRGNSGVIKASPLSLSDRQVSIVRGMLAGLKDAELAAQLYGSGREENKKKIRRLKLEVQRKLVSAQASATAAELAEEELYRLAGELWPTLRETYCARASIDQTLPEYQLIQCQRRSYCVRIVPGRLARRWRDGLHTFRPEQEPAVFRVAEDCRSKLNRLPPSVPAGLAVSLAMTRKCLEANDKIGAMDELFRAGHLSILIEDSLRGTSWKDEEWGLTQLIRDVAMEIPTYSAMYRVDSEGAFRSQTSSPVESIKNPPAIRG